MSGPRAARAHRGGSVAARLGTALVTLAALACVQGPPAMSVLLVTLDTTRADHLGPYGYAHVETPALDALAAQGLVFERCYAPVPLTLPSHSSLMTGLWPPRHGVRVNGERPLAEGAETLAELLSQRGYATGAAIGAFVLDRQFGLAQGFAHYDDDLSRGRDPGRFSYARRDAGLVTDAALAWLRETGRGPYFLWVHYYDPHSPYEVPADAEAGRGGGSSLLPYDAALGYVDTQLARLWQSLDESGRAADTLVIVTGDHGEALWEHGEVTHGLFTYDSTLRIPLLVRFPDRRAAGVRIAEPVALVDLFPSILTWVGAAVPPNLDGRVLPLDPAAESTERLIYFENLGPERLFGWSALRGFVAGDLKLIAAPRPELYDLARDPHEQRDLYDPSDAGSRARLDALRALREELEGRAGTRGEPLALDPESAARLQALGYASHGFGAAPGDPGDDAAARADPKDRVAVYHAVEFAMSRIEQGELGPGVDGLVEVVTTSDPANRRAFSILASLAVEEASVRARAIEGLAVLLERSSGDRNLDLFARTRLGEALEKEGRLAQAASAYRLALEADPARPMLHYQLGRTYERLGERERAIASLEASLERAADGSDAWHEEARSRLAALRAHP